MPTLFVEFDPPEPCPYAFQGDTSDLVYFMSFAYSARYGSTHELTQAALLLRGELKIDLRPLLTFADSDVEVEADAEALERAWQDAGPLSECCRQMVAALDSGHDKLRKLTEGFPALRDRLSELQRTAEWAAERGARVRLTYKL